MLRRSLTSIDICTMDIGDQPAICIPARKANNNYSNEFGAVRFLYFAHTQGMSLAGHNIKIIVVIPSLGIGIRMHVCYAHSLHTCTVLS